MQHCGKHWEVTATNLAVAVQRAVIELHVNIQWMNRYPADKIIIFQLIYFYPLNSELSAELSYALFEQLGPHLWDTACM